MQNIDNVRIAGMVVDFLDLIGCPRHSIQEVIELVKRHLEVKDNYPSANQSPSDVLPKPCVN